MRCTRLIAGWSRMVSGLGSLLLYRTTLVNVRLVNERSPVILKYIKNPAI